MGTNRMAMVVVALALAGCGSKKDDGAKGTSTGTASGSTGSANAGSAGAGSAAAGSAAAGSADTADGVVASPVDTTAVQAVVDAWLAAQNTGDFAAYSALYAEKFAGIKRAGSRTWRFDRAGWIKDRQRMSRRR